MSPFRLCWVIPTLALSFSAQAAGWTVLKNTTEYRLMVQPPQHEPDAPVARIWTLRNYYRTQYTADGMAFRSLKSLLAFDCQSGVYQGLMVVLAPNYNGTGSPSRSLEIQTPWQTTVPDTPEAAIQAVACKP